LIWFSSLFVTNFFKQLQLAEARKVYAEDRQAEVELLERSIEELESTLNVLESNVSCYFW
jgi:hypothetical protein